MVQNTIDEKTPQPKSEKMSHLMFDPEKIWKQLAPKLMNLVNISALLTVAGFFVVQSYLSSFTSLFTFNISVTQYLAAGVNLILAIFWNLILPVLAYSFILAFVLVFLYFLGRFSFNRSKRVQNLWTRFLSRILPLYQRLRLALRVIWAIYQVFAGGLFVLLVIGVAFIYGTSYYAQSPRMFGGGMPSEVILVFREEQPTQPSIWGFPINTATPRQSEPVQLLIELTDGVIVRDTATNKTIIVKNDVLQGIIDTHPVSSNPMTATAAPTQLSGTPTP
ncbi:MAG: hypothetical protein GC179_18545 [Anaerolineaceae bacterium]|nr:hypothetical protein [Anaerolineaceae bacterium]